MQIFFTILKRKSVLSILLTFWMVSACALNYTVNIAEMRFAYCENNFANTAIAQEADLSVAISTTPHRIGAENLIALTYCNVGAKTARNVTLELRVDENLTLIESSIPWRMYAGSVATWNLGNLEMGDCFTLFVKDFVSGETEVGTVIELNATITSENSETITANNIDAHSDPAVGSFDPNDISVNPEGYIENDQELIYTIRFQNVGNAPASTVRIIDQLPEALNIESFQMGIASHPYRLDIEGGNVLVWTFENINLVGSTTNEAESNGYVIFKIQPEEALSDGTAITNNAAIYFDNNDPIYTNVVINTIGEEPLVELANGNTEEESFLKIYPSPMVSNSMIQILNENGSIVIIKGLIIRDLMGKKLMERKGLALEEYRLKKESYNPGYYVIKVEGANGKEYVTQLIVH